MKRLLNILAFVAVLSASFACEEVNVNPTAEFKDKILTLQAAQSVEVVVNLDQPAVAAVSIPVEITCESEAYQVSDQSFDFAEGGSSASITVTDAGLPAGESITLKLLSVEGIQIGTNFTCVITKAAPKTLVYNFGSASVDLVAGGTAKVTLSLTESGANFVAAVDMNIPVVLEGEGKDWIGFEEGVTGFTVKQGQNTAVLQLIAVADFTEEKTVTLTLGDYQNATLVAGETGSVSVKLCNALSAADLVGTWTYNQTYAVEEIMLWFEEGGDDTSLLPLNNEGFTLTFAEDENGNVTLTPGTTGDFAKFFRAASLTLTEPVNLTSYGENTGAYTALDLNMFLAEAVSAEAPFNYTFFELSSANRAFSAETETLGAAVIALRLTEDGDLELSFKDYDQPPFGEIWWDGFEPDMFGFCSVFTKAE